MPDAMEGHEAVELLARTRAVVTPHLRATVASLPESVRRVAMHHFGWGRADDAPGGAAHAGRAIRPALVLAAAAALGGGPEAAARAAAAVELVHHFTLLHDGVLDEDATRHHHPTARTVFGTRDAVVVGDALLALALRLLADDPHPAAAAASARLAACVVELCAGRQADCAFEHRTPPDASLDECLATATARAGALLGCACALGALYAGAGEEEVAAMDAFGREAGLAFQLIDDLIGIWGDSGPAGVELAAHRKSLPVVAALCSGTPAAAELAALYAGPTGADTACEAADAVDRAGGRDWAQIHAADRMARAVDHLARAVPDPAAAGELLSLAEFITRRGE